MEKESNSETLGYFYIFVWSGFAYVTTTGISVDAVVELYKGSLETS